MNPQQYTVTPVARIHTDYQSKFGIPRQSGMTDSKGIIVFEPGFRNPDAVRGIEEFSHLWLLWVFSENVDKEFTPTVRPPRLGGNERRGVFATRAPFRPNHIGMSCVRLESVDYDSPDGPVLKVSGADMLDGTPIIDIKPYVSMDCIPDAACGFSDAALGYRLKVSVPDESVLSPVPLEKRQALSDILALDPRPSYHNDPERVYGLPFAGLEVRFTVDGHRLTVRSVEPAGS